MLKQVQHDGWVVLAPLLIGAAPAGADITVAVSGVRSAQGRVHVELCTEAQFLKDCPLWDEAPAVAGTTLVTIRDVPPGIWAAQGYQDRNSNRRIDRGLFGIPREGVGFSNDARIRFAPPKFAEAEFAHGAVPQRIAFKLRYFM